MIRRDDRDRWLLISQVDHARLAAEVAGAWGNARFARPEPVAWTLPAIAHHDDGWAAWERRPRIDPGTGKPFSFFEMPIADSIDLWRSSIARCAQESDFGGAIVSRHFSHLAE